MSKLKDKVMDALKEVYDPEIPFNIVDLGLIYEVNVDENNNVHIKMTLTFPGCPIAGFITEQVRNAVKAIDEVNDVEVELVWDPPWTPERISPELRAELGLE
jgi:FeS assembly SUF system protein